MKNINHKIRQAYEPIPKPRPSEDMVKQYLTSTGRHDIHKSEKIRLQRKTAFLDRSNVVRRERQYVMGVEHFPSQGDSINLVTYQEASRIIPNDFVYNYR